MTVLLMKMNLRYEHPSPPLGNEPANIHIELLNNSRSPMIIEKIVVTI